ncbi:MAG TPA: DUF1501 domain-containing protein [Isosphaeraceae bacterium]|jgi:hypothetical protein|nr:DUF1501 domain-containing protein [Isosphaeraceae bacterium]
MRREGERPIHSRRGLFRAGVALAGVGGLARAALGGSKGSGLPPVKACILVFYYGGPSHLDTFDPKPGAPAEVRGEFATIATSVPGLRVAEHLPQMAKVMHKVAVVRSMSHGYRLHDSASMKVLTGREPPQGDQELFAPAPQVFPSYGGALSYLRREQRLGVPFAALPFAFHNVVPTPCQGGGFLGSAYDPLQVVVDAETRSYRADMLEVPDGLTAPRMARRRDLLGAVERGALLEEPAARMRGLYDRAYRVLDSAAIRRALAIDREDPRVRERYGFGPPPASVGSGGGGGNGAELGFARQMRGQNLLLARRLVEAGVPFVNVYDFRQQGQNWDAHFRCFDQHKTHLLPLADRSLSALIEDLDARGLLDTTLVIALGEFGRTPRINKDGGRDHWPDCYSILLAGGGVRGGAVHGASDRLGAYPAADPVTPADLAATIYWRFGVDPRTEVHDANGRPFPLALGEPIRAIFG